MLRQLIKIMWHRKGKNFLLLIEIFFSFIVLFATSTLIFESFRNYLTPTGFDYQDVYVLSIEWHGEGKATTVEKLKQIKREIESFPEVVSFSLASVNTPYGNSFMNWDVSAGDRSEIANQYVVDPSYFETMDLELASGRFIEKGDKGNIKPFVINEALAEKLYPGENPVGKRIRSGSEEQQGEVVGVVKYFRQDGEFSSPDHGMFHLANLDDTTSHIPSHILIEVKQGVGSGWQPLLVEKIYRIAGDWTIELDPLSAERMDKAKFTLVPIIALSIVCGFLIFNVALGLFGVLWYNINKRYAEIGIRRALGATKNSVRLQMLGEVLVLASLGLVAGIVLAVQFPLLGVFNVESGIYVFAIGASLFLIYLLVAFCAWYPSRQASLIEPAEALHYE